MGHASFDTHGFAFDVIGSGGDEEMCLTKDGPDLVAAGTTGTITANFIVDADFVPVTLTFAMLFGPSASADVPPLSSSN